MYAYVLSVFLYADGTYQLVSIELGGETGEGKVVWYGGPWIAFADYVGLLTEGCGNNVRRDLALLIETSRGSCSSQSTPIKPVDRRAERGRTRALQETRVELGLVAVIDSDFW